MMAFLKVIGLIIGFLLLFILFTTLFAIFFALGIALAQIISLFHSIKSCYVGIHDGISNKGFRIFMYIQISILFLVGIGASIYFLFINI